MREGHRTVVGALIPFVAALFKATTFGDAAEACKVGGAKLKAKARRTKYVTDKDNLPPDPGAMSLVFLMKRTIRWVSPEVEGV